MSTHATGPGAYGTPPDAPLTGESSIAPSCMPCDQCRVMRKRCDRTRPHCARCSERRIKCAYTGKGKGIEKNPQRVRKQAVERSRGAFVRGCQEKVVDHLQQHYLDASNERGFESSPADALVTALRSAKSILPSSVSDVLSVA